MPKQTKSLPHPARPTLPPVASPPDTGANTIPISEQDWIEGKRITKYDKNDGLFHGICKCGTLLRKRTRRELAEPCWFCTHKHKRFQKSERVKHEQWKQDRREYWRNYHEMRNAGKQHTLNAKALHTPDSAESRRVSTSPQPKCAPRSRRVARPDAGHLFD